jgi:hypothetical protein
VAGTVESRILGFEHGEMIMDLQYTAPESKDASRDSEEIRQPQISAISSFPYGLMLGLDNGAVVYYEKTPNGPQKYRKKKEVFLEYGKIMGICWNLKEERAVVGLSTSQIFILHIETDVEVLHQIM